VFFLNCYVDNYTFATVRSQDNAEINESEGQINVLPQHLNQRVAEKRAGDQLDGAGSPANGSPADIALKPEGAQPPVEPTE
jgi:hypothetical protein